MKNRENVCCGLHFSKEIKLLLYLNSSRLTSSNTRNSPICTPLYLNSSRVTSSNTRHSPICTPLLVNRYSNRLKKISWYVYQSWPWRWAVFLRVFFYYCMASFHVLIFSSKTIGQLNQTWRGLWWFSVKHVPGIW
jgi:hypothetical protein